MRILLADRFHICLCYPQPFFGTVRQCWGCALCRTGSSVSGECD